MSRSTSDIRNVLVVLRMTGASGREFFGGILKYARAPHHWNIRFLNMPELFTPEKAQGLRDEGFDGILASEFGSIATQAVLERSDIPLVVLGSSVVKFAARRHRIGFVRIDDTAIGRAGAQHFGECGNFASYGFAQGAPGWFWSEQRFDAFAAALSKQGKDVSRAPVVGDLGSKDDLLSLAGWLLGLPKPCAVMADYDYRGIQVLEACRQAQLDVPREVAVLGVDNDEMLCDFSDPPLTSILPDHELAAFNAAEMLDRMMDGKTFRHTPTALTGPKRIVSRESTAPISPAAHIIREALAYIERHATEGISISDVVHHLGVSRRLADLRFQQFYDKTINEVLVATRLDAVCRELRTTSRPVAQIAANCGFANTRSLHNLFKKKFGLTMSEYRKQNHKCPLLQ